MIYDCFIFFNELELLDIRLNVLNEKVDKFVLVESTRTFTNNPKPLYFQENKHRFEKFSDKIIHVVIDEFPEFTNAWDYETFQRNSIKEGLKNCNLDDIVLISDIDEIPNLYSINANSEVSDLAFFQQTLYYYFLNYKLKRAKLWNGTAILRFKDFTEAQNIRDKRNRKKYSKIKNGGWHFSYLGGAEKIKQKIEAFAHQEYNSEKFKDIDRINLMINQGKDLFGRKKYSFKVVKLDNTFPNYILKSKDKYSQLIAPYQPNILEKMFNKIFAKP